MGKAPKARLTQSCRTNKKPRGSDAMIDKMSDNNHIKLYNIEIKVYVWLQDLPFSRYKVTENRISTKCVENDLMHFTVKSTPYTLNIHPRGAYFTAFRSTTSYFRDMLSKI